MMSEAALDGSRRPARRRAPVRIGMTGPIGCGKSTVASWLGELGAAVIDADGVAREVHRARHARARRDRGDVRRRSCIREDGALDRAALGPDRVRRPGGAARLEAIVHPAVRPADPRRDRGGRASRRPGRRGRGDQARRGRARRRCATRSGSWSATPTPSERA